MRRNGRHIGVLFAAGEESTPMNLIDVALQFKVDFKVYLEGPIMVVKGGRELDSDFEDDEDECNPKIYLSKLSLDAGLHTCKIEGIKAVLKSGVLKVTIPKVKHEE